MDPVSDYLIGHGYSVTKAYYDKTQFEIGYCLDMQSLSLTYRLEEDTLVICYFEVKSGEDPSKNAVTILVKLLKRLINEVDAVKCIKGLIIDQVPDVDLCKARRRLRDVFLANHAVIKEDQYGDPWLIYPGKKANKRPK